MQRVALVPAEIEATVAEIGRLVGLDVSGAELIKFTNNAVLRLPRAAVVLRIAGSAVIGRRADDVVRAARLLAANAVPAIRLWPGTDHPTIVRGHEITIWDEVPALRAPEPDDLAALLRVLHEVTDRPPGLRGWEPVAAIRRRIGSATGVNQRVLRFLTAECDEVDGDLAELASVEPLLSRGLVHGDAFLGNVVVGPAGPVLCDFDSTCWGPREWDLTPVAVGALRFDYGADLQRRLAAAYGVDVTEWKGFPALRRIRELQLVTSVLPVLGANPGLRPQWWLRLRSLQRRDVEARWTPYARS